MLVILDGFKGNYFSAMQFVVSTMHIVSPCKIQTLSPQFFCVVSSGGVTAVV